MFCWRDRASFTLIELLIVIAVIAVLAVIVVLVLNPAELLRQSRDGGRLSDMKTLDQAIQLYEEDTGRTLGVILTTYVSIPDPVATSTAGDQCQGLGLPALPAGDIYHCAAQADYKNTNGDGWIPIDFTAASYGSPLGSLPVDPINQTSSGLYYTYTTNGSAFEVTAIMESAKYKAKLEEIPTQPDYPGVDAQGSNLALSELYNPAELAGYWNFDDGSGTTAADSSGNGNVGTLYNSPTWTSGKIQGALDFNGTNQYVDINNSILNNAAAFSVIAWVKTNSTSPDNSRVVTKGDYIGSNGGGFLLREGGTGSRETAEIHDVNNSSYYCDLYSGSTEYNTAWHEIGIVYTGSLMEWYFDGTLATSTACSGITMTTTDNLQISGYNNGYARVFNGKIDDARVYDRAVSAAEVQAIYNAEK